MCNEEILKRAKEKINDIMLDMSAKTCCFTGHRSQKLPWGFNENDIRYKHMINELSIEIKKAILDGYDTFICGMAIGFDMACAETVLLLKESYDQIKLVCAVPCKGQEKVWSVNHQKRYHKILEKADKIRCVYEKYEDGCMQERNKFMINSSSLVLALFNGKPGGTKQTIEYAKKLGKKIIIIKPEE